MSCRYASTDNPFNLHKQYSRFYVILVPIRKKKNNLLINHLTLSIDLGGCRGWHHVIRTEIAIRALSVIVNIRENDNSTVSRDYINEH